MESVSARDLLGEDCGISEVGLIVLLFEGGKCCWKHR